jgi:hypothetical protein
MLSKKKWLYTLALLLYVNSVNIGFLVLHWAGVALIRPPVVYEYFLVALLIAIRAPKIVVYTFFLLIFIIDVLIQLSFIYLFNVGELIASSRFIAQYDVTPRHLILLVVFGILCIGIFYSIKFFLAHKELTGRKVFVVSALVFLFIYSIDFLNGKTLLNNHRIISLGANNIGTTIMREMFFIIRDLSTSAEKPDQLADGALTFKTFEKDTSGNQLLILVESWGSPANEKDQLAMFELLVPKAVNSGWGVQVGQTEFSGGTVHAELRELMSSTGDYRYLMDADSAKHIRSIFNIKRAQGYTTIAIHSFSFKMFQRNIWWRNVGIDSAYFLENVIKAQNLTAADLNRSSPFVALPDELAFDFVNKPASEKKKFVYFLTVNSHLPFVSKMEMAKEQTVWAGSTLTEEGKNQLARILQLIEYFIEESDKGGWEKILMVGDHMPPFTNANDRSFYSPKKVPFLILNRKTQALK